MRARIESRSRRKGSGIQLETSRATVCIGVGEGIRECAEVNDPRNEEKLTRSKENKKTRKTEIAHESNKQRSTESERSTRAGDSGVFQGIGERVGAIGIGRPRKIAPCQLRAGLALHDASEPVLEFSFSKGRNMAWRRGAPTPNQQLTMQCSWGRTRVRKPTWCAGPRP